MDDIDGRFIVLFNNGVLSGDIHLLFTTVLYYFIFTFLPPCWRVFPIHSVSHVAIEVAPEQIT